MSPKPAKCPETTWQAYWIGGVLTFKSHMAAWVWHLCSQAATAGAQISELPFSTREFPTIKHSCFPCLCFAQRTVHTCTHYTDTICHFLILSYFAIQQCPNYKENGGAKKRQVMAGAFVRKSQDWDRIWLWNELEQVPKALAALRCTGHMTLGMPCLRSHRATQKQCMNRSNRGKRCRSICIHTINQW